MSYLDHKRQILVKEQSVAGTYDAPSAADGKVRLVLDGDPVEMQAEKHERNVARPSLTRLAPIGGTKAWGFPLRSEINTPDDITAALEHAVLIKSCGHALTQARRIPIGAITGGPIPRNATMTGGTSGATGRVWLEATTGDTHIYFVPIAGTFQAEALTFTGGASATSSAVSAAYGWSALPSDPTVVASIRYEEDGYFWAARDAMGTLSAEFEAAKQGFMDFDMVGVHHLAQAGAMTSGIAYDVEIPPVLYDAGLRLGSFAPVFSKWSFEQAMSVVKRQDGNAPGNTGLRGARGTTRDPKITLSYEHVDEGTFDVYGLHHSSTPIAFKHRQGVLADPGKRFFFFADQAVVNGVSLSSGDGIRMAEVTLTLTHTTDNREYEMIWA